MYSSYPSGTYVAFFYACIRYAFPVLLAITSSIAQKKESAETQFIDALIAGDSTLSRFVDADEFKLSQRLGIAYEGIREKWLISYGFDDQTKQQLHSKQLTLSRNVEQLDSEYSKITTEIPAQRQSKSFYFKNGKVISPVKFYTEHWSRLESDYFRFILSDSTLFHIESIAQLEHVILEIAKLLELTGEQLHLLKKEKIFYFLCRDENEIEKLTGYKSRGMALLAYDYVVTTYNCHVHELLHLLINFKLRTLPLYTHPLLQEGFAVRFGGRGGIAASSLLQTGAFLVQSKFIDVQDLFSSLSFSQNDPSITYPVSGLYNAFLMSQFDMAHYLSLYRKYSSSKGNSGLNISSDDLPSETLWNRFLDSLSRNEMILLSSPKTTFQPFISNANGKIDTSEFYLHISAKNSFALRSETYRQDYSSKRFKELFPSTEYNGEHFLLMVDSNEVTIYDLYTNNSIAGYSTGFSMIQQPVPYSNGVFEFWIRKDILHVSLDEMKIVNVSSE